MSFYVITGLAISVAVIIMFPFFIIVPLLLLLAMGSGIK
jgi:hypothetical protein